MMFVPHREHAYGPPWSVAGIALFLYVDDIDTSQETSLWVSMACYGDRITFLYVDDVRTSQEVHIRASTDCTGINLLFFYLEDIRTSQETHH
jgi:hypothetical protein